jgi:hypothetical protein
MASIAVAEATLSSRAMLCAVSISMWSAQKHDREASEEIATRHGAQADAGRYHKVPKTGVGGDPKNRERGAE